ncbi:hypothetical protein L6R52_12790 [Myxococcota bacterium]|nr:hypothetical protein [Myxococcota bacterium]
MITVALRRPLVRGTVLLSALTLAAACGTEAPSSELDPTLELHALVSEVNGFHFYPPLAPPPSSTGTFDASLLPELAVHVDELDASGRVARTVATFTQRSTPAIKLVGYAEQYFVNVPAHAVLTNRAVTYRFRVTALGRELGFSDLSSRVWEFMDRYPSLLIGVRLRIETQAVRDVDQDGAVDVSDNCPTLANADQRDSDRDGRGDACECAGVTCPVADACHEPSVCEPTTGECTNVPRPAGTPCNDGDLCTQSDACFEGVCVGAHPVTCGAPGVCREAGVCNPSTGTCEFAPVANGTACTDQSVCTNGDTCQGGTCVPGPILQCTDGAICDPESGCIELGNNRANPGRNCYNILLTTGGRAQDGVYWLDPSAGDSSDAFQAYCDMTRNGGGWTLVMQNNRAVTMGPDPAWSAAVNDVNVTGTFGGDLRLFDLWLGVGHWSDLGVSMRIEAGASPSSITKQAIYRYTMNPSTYAMTFGAGGATIGTTEPGMKTYHAGASLSTSDRDNDSYGTACYAQYGYPWWYVNCWSGSLWGSRLGGYQNAAFWTGSTTDYHDYGAVWVKGCTADAECDDGLRCTGQERCVLGVCRDGADPCDDGVACTRDLCEESTVACTWVADDTRCNDGNQCTDDVCNASTGCTAIQNNRSCDDGDPCTTNDACFAGTCGAGVPMSCGAAGQCTPGVGCETYGTSAQPGTSCGDILGKNPSATNGVYWVDTNGGSTSDALQVYCDMTRDGGGWSLVLQNNSAVAPGPDPTFAQVQTDRNVTGTFSTNLAAFDLFLGVQHWAPLGDRMRVEVGTTPASITKQAIYAYTMGASPGYALTFGTGGPTIGTTEPGLKTYHAGRAISTRDRDADAYSGHCAASYGYAWWYGTCWDGSFWGSRLGGHANAAFWTGSSSDYHNYGAIWVKPQCGRNEDCDNGVFCDGVEQCVAGRCVAGTTPTCGDAHACTVDVCNRALDRCANLPDDGQCATGSVCIPGSGCVAGATSMSLPRSCRDVLAANRAAKDGLYWVDPTGVSPADAIPVFCDMTRDGGGWALVLMNNASVAPGPDPTYANVVSSLNFSGDYGNDLAAFDLFLGLSYWSNLGSEMRVEVGPTIGTIAKQAFYPFSLNASRSYALTLGTGRITRGTTAPGLKTSHSAGTYGISTVDRDNDGYGGNCAASYGYPWWYVACWDGSLWGSRLGGYQDAPYWSGSSSDYHGWGALWVR